MRKWDTSTNPFHSLDCPPLLRTRCIRIRWNPLPEQHNAVLEVPYGLGPEFTVDVDSNTTEKSATSELPSYRSWGNSSGDLYGDNAAETHEREASRQWLKSLKRASSDTLIGRGCRSDGSCRSSA